MSTIAVAPASAAETGVAAKSGRSLFRRLVDALVAARMRQAEREVNRYRHLVPRNLEGAAWKLTERSEDSLPFQR